MAKKSLKMLRETTAKIQDYFNKLNYIEDFLTRLKPDAEYPLDLKIETGHYIQNSWLRDMEMERLSFALSKKDFFEDLKHKCLLEIKQSLLEAKTNIEKDLENINEKQFR